MSRYTVTDTRYRYDYIVSVLVRKAGTDVYRYRYGDIGDIGIGDIRRFFKVILTKVLRIL